MFFSILLGRIYKDIKKKDKYSKFSLFVLENVRKNQNA